MDSFKESLEKNRSTLKNNYRFKVFVLGAKKHFELTIPDFWEIHYVDEMVDAQILHKITDNYTPAEACWALKSVLMLELIHEYKNVFYFDSDIYFFGDLALLDSELGDANILLTPHYLKPYPDDGFAPNDLTLLRSGVFNAGFIGVKSGAESERFLRWWQNRTLRFGRNDPDNGMCGDQKWLDLVPVLFENVKICRHSGFNVAYWNLDERRLVSVDGTYMCENDTLVFFHFSGFDPSEHHMVVSKHQNRIIMSHQYSELFQFYKTKINAYTGIFSGAEFQYYKYSKYWHAYAKQYRKIQDKFKNPRK
jgi:hypothetical protein